MDEVFLRVGVVVAAFGAVGLYWWLRHRSERAPRRVTNTGLGPGLYLLTSDTCASCDTARQVLEKAGLADAYVEIRWTGEPDLFAQLSVEGVPSLLEVDASGDGTLRPGPPRIRDLRR